MSFVPFDEFDQDNKFPHKSSRTILDDLVSEFDGVQSIQAGIGITVDDTDPANPFVSATPYSLPQATGTVLGGVRLGEGLVYNPDTQQVDAISSDDEGGGGNVLPWDLTGVEAPAAITLVTLPPEYPYTNAAVITGDLFEVALTLASTGMEFAFGTVHLADIGVTGKQYFEWVPGVVTGTPMQSMKTLYIGESIAGGHVISIGLTPDGLKSTIPDISEVILDATHGEDEYVRVYIDVDNGDVFVQTANIGVVHVATGLSLTGLKIFGMSQLVAQAAGSYTITTELGDDLGSGFVTESGYSPITTRTVALPETASVGDELTVAVAGTFDGVQYGIGDGATVVSVEPPSVTPKGATSAQVAAVEAALTVTTARANARTAAFSTLSIEPETINSLSVGSYTRGYFLDFSAMIAPIGHEIRLYGETYGPQLGEEPAYDGQVVEFIRIDEGIDPASIMFMDYSVEPSRLVATVPLLQGDKVAFQYFGGTIGFVPYDEGVQQVTAVVQQCIPMACSDETTDLTTGLKLTFRMPYAMTLTEVRASFTTISLYPSIVDIHCNGVSIFTLGNLLTIDTEEKSSVTGTPYEFNDNHLPDNSEIEVYLTDIGAGTPKGLKVYLIGVVG